MIREIRKEQKLLHLLRYISGVADKGPHGIRTLRKRVPTSQVNKHENEKCVRNNI